MERVHNYTNNKKNPIVVNSLNIDLKVLKQNYVYSFLAMTMDCTSNLLVRNKIK
jgi:hypothetical protein